MKLHLILLASLFHLSSGFEVELKGPMNEEACTTTGKEYADFKHCVKLGVALSRNPSLEVLTGLNGDAFMHRKGDRQLQSYCAGCPGGSPRGSFCFTYCGMRRRLDEDTDKSNLRRVQQADSVLFKGGAYTPANGEAQHIAQVIIECLVDDYPCLGNPVDMTLTVTV
jgi:hypothetical protein